VIQRIERILQIPAKTVEINNIIFAWLSLIKVKIQLQHYRLANACIVLSFSFKLNQLN
jgi:hypothetical protein